MESARRKPLTSIAEIAPPPRSCEEKCTYSDAVAYQLNPTTFTGSDPSMGSSGTDGRRVGTAPSARSPDRSGVISGSGPQEGPATVTAGDRPVRTSAPSTRAANREAAVTAAQ